MDSAFYAPPPEALKWQARACELAPDASTERDAVEQLNFHQRDLFCFIYYYSCLNHEDHTRCIFRCEKGYVKNIL